MSLLLAHISNRSSMSEPETLKPENNKINFNNVEELAKSDGRQIDDHGHSCYAAQLPSEHISNTGDGHRSYWGSLWLQDYYRRFPPASSEKCEEENRQSYKVKTEAFPSRGLELKVSKQLDVRHPFNMLNGLSESPSPSLSSPSGSMSSSYGNTDDDKEELGADMSDLAFSNCMRKYRKQRTVFETHQLKALEEMFEKNQYPTSEEYDQLGSRISIDEQRLRIWFQNRRARHKRSAKGQLSDSDKLQPVPSLASLPLPLSALTNHPLRHRFANLPLTAAPHLMLCGGLPYPFLSRPYYM